MVLGATGNPALNCRQPGLDVYTVDGRQPLPRSSTPPSGLVNSQRASFGAPQSRFETTVNNLQTTSEKTCRPQCSRIQDADFAFETAARRVHADPAAGRHRHGGPGQPAAPGRAVAAALMQRRAVAASSSALQQIQRGGSAIVLFVNIAPTPGATAGDWRCSAVYSRFCPRRR